MSLVTSLACAFAFQQLSVSPLPARVGDEVIVRLVHEGAPVVGVDVWCEPSEDARKSIGRTDLRGEVRLRPGEPGNYAFGAEVAGVRCLAPLGVGPRRVGPWLAIGTVPLGLALLWLQLRSYSRRAPRKGADVPDGSTKAPGPRVP